MGTIKQHFSAPMADFRAATAFPQYIRNDGTNFPVPVLAYDASSEEDAFFLFRAINYGSGNLTITINWYADTATSGGVSWGVSLACITPNTDTQDIETKAFATETIISDTHLGTTGQRDHDVVGTLSNLDSLAADDLVALKLARKPADAGDTMSGDANFVFFTIAWSDT